MLSLTFLRFESFKELFILGENNQMAKEQGTKENPWILKTPPLTSDFTMHRDVKDEKEILVCTVGKTVLHYDYRCLSDIHTMLKKHGDWMDLGSVDDQKPAKKIQLNHGAALKIILLAVGMA